MMNSLKEMMCRKIALDITELIEESKILDNIKCSEEVSEKAFDIINCIKAVLHRNDELTDMEMIEEIVTIFEKYGIRI